MNSQNNHSIAHVYYDVLKKFPFSISGYSDPEHEYARFFNQLCKHEENIDNEKITFLISGFAKLIYEENGNSEINFKEWKTEGLKKFLFHDLSSGFPEYILSMYVYALHILSPDKRVVNILASNIRNDLIISVELSNKIEKITFQFQRQGKVLRILVPSAIYKGGGEIKDSALYLQTILKKDEYKHLNKLAIENKFYNNEYSISSNLHNSTEEKNLYEKLCQEFMLITPAKFKQDIEIHIPSKELQIKLQDTILLNKEYNFKDLLTLAYVSSIYCYFYRSSINYFVSTAMVDGNQKYTLGAIGVGLKEEHKLTREERGFYSLVVNHIAANLSTQIVFDNNKVLKRKARKERLKRVLEQFKTFDQGEIHGKTKVQDVIEDFIDKNISVLTPIFKNYFSRLKEESGGYISKYCLAQLKYSMEVCKDCKVENCPLTLFKNNGLKCCNSIGSANLINAPLLHDMFSSLTKKKGYNTVVNVKIQISSESIEAEVYYSDGFNINDGPESFLQKLKENHNGDFIGTFCRDYYHEIDCHGVFQMMYSNGSNEWIDFYNSRDTILTIAKEDDHKKIVLNPNFNFPDVGKVKNIKLEFKNELYD